ncbi:MAG: Maf family protein [Candidatus Nitrospinota bacterium M3_3B_026]
MRLVLASSSPRRARLLKEAGFSFDIAPSSAPEDINPSLGPGKNARLIAIRKAGDVAASRPDDAVLAADTMVVVDGRILGKPVDENDARRMLKKLSGREHKVITGVAVICPARREEWSHVEVSRVRFRKVPEKAVEEYVESGEPMDKAGGYAIQGGAGEWIEGYEGSLTNIIGLPMEPLLEELERLGFETSRGGGESCR